MTRPLRFIDRSPEPGRTGERAVQFHFVLLLVPGYSSYEIATVVAVLHAANLCNANPKYIWRLVSEAGDIPCACEGLDLPIDAKLSDIQQVDVVLVFGEPEISSNTGLDARTWLRKAERSGAVIGAVGGGVQTLAEAGLFDGRQVVTHWGQYAGLREKHPRVDPIRSIFALGERRLSCAGGAATLDFMLTLVASQQSRACALAVADHLACSNIRAGNQRQTLAEPCRNGTRNTKLSAAIELMRDEFDQNQSLATIAARIGLSTRQLERLFSRYLGTSPRGFLTEIRLENSRSLLYQTTMTITEIAAASGFESAAQFSRTYRKHFGVSPSYERLGEVKN